MRHYASATGGNVALTQQVLSMDENDLDEASVAEDAIPINAAWFTEAYSMVVEALIVHPEKTADIDEEWIELLRQSRELERTAGHDPGEFDADFEEFWHLRKVANIILRSALANAELSACTRDPRTGETLQLPASGWFSKEWIARGYIPSGIWQDHAIPEDNEIPGPKATLIAGQLRPIFFILDELEIWLSEVFGPDVDSDSPSSDFQKSKRPRDAVKEAILSIWGKPPPSGVNWKKRNAKIESWLKTEDREEVSQRTISRAIAEMRDSR
jgi:hypothetical protein